ncbi:MAG: ice-binding family protein [Nonlabens sp.]|uniref:ice-binding family protein n=1 Tax=Nonlabens sp. TaxID=1888209 RepID=UPI0035A72ABB
MQKFGDNSTSIDNNAVLELESKTKGFLLPRMTKAQKDLITNPPEGLMLWCTDCSFSSGSEIVVWIKDSWTGLLISNLGNNNLLLGNANGKATAVTFSGDVTIDNAGVSAIGTSKVLSSMILDGTLIAADIADNAVTNAKLDKTNIPLSGFGTATTTVELGGNKLTGLAEPTDSDDAATKNYVDNGIAEINTLADGKVYLGNSGNVATQVALSGDIVIDNKGSSTIVNSAITEDKISRASVTYSKIQYVTSNTILGRTSEGTGSVQEIATTGTLNVVLSESPILSGVPMAPTALPSTNTDQIATTAFVLANVANSANSTHSSVNTSDIISTSSNTDVLMTGMSKSPVPGTYLVFFNSQYSISPANKSNVISTPQGIEDLRVIYDEINNLPVTNWYHPITIVNGERLEPGVYSFPGALSIAGILTLDAKNNPNAVFVFKTVGAFNTGAGVEIKLINGASACNIYWLAEGAVGLGAGTIMKGNLISHGAAVALGEGSQLEGRMLSTAGAIAVNTSTVGLPSGSSSINFRTLSSFVMFTAAGALGNTGVSTYNGDMATGLGAITGFETATINGTVFPSGGETTVVSEINGNATFSLYQNGVLIPNSSRIRTTQINTADVSLQAIATIAGGETIDVRWNIDAGTLSAKNRILTIIKVQ